MDLNDLLCELRENILHDRSDRVPGSDDDGLWSDKTLIRYINEAHMRFAKRSECIRDGLTPEVCQITTVVGNDLFPLHRSILGVLSARFLGDQADLARAGHANLDTYHVPDTYFFNPSELSNLQPGKTLAFATDESMAVDDNGSYSVVMFRTYPIVGVGYNGTINLRVVRLPLRRFTLDNMTASPEIPEQYHLDMLDWAGYLALRQPDLDIAGGDAPQRAKDLAASFEQHCKDAKNDLMKKTFTPLQWEFGRNGWSYERD